MKTRPVRVELFHTQTGGHRHDEASSRSSQFWERASYYSAENGGRPNTHILQYSRQIDIILTLIILKQSNLHAIGCNNPYAMQKVICHTCHDGTATPQPFAVQG